MDLSLENIAIALFFILPGFISAAIRNMARPGAAESVGDWVVTSVVASLVLNAIVVAGLVLKGWALDFHQSIPKVIEALKDYEAEAAVWYVAILYGLAVAWGILSACLWHWRPRSLAFLLRLTPVMPDDDVFNPTFEELFRTSKDAKKLIPDQRPVPWLRIHLEHMTIFGRMQTSSVTIEQDKPFELYLEPAFAIDDNGTQLFTNIDGAHHKGVYLRIEPDKVMEIFSAPASWRPPI